MSASTDSTRAGLTSIRRQRTYPHPPADVWAALTQPDLLTAWFMRTDDFVPSPGTTFTLIDDQARGWSGRVRGTVLDAQPPHRLVYRWKADDDPDVTTVTWTLTATQNGGTDLTLVHGGFRRHPRSIVTRAFLDLGWRSMLRTTLAAAIERAATRA
jgi:uncharacterized protein YndB with AHSA1/START domain